MKFIRMCVCIMVCTNYYYMFTKWPTSWRLKISLLSRHSHTPHYTKAALVSGHSTLFTYSLTHLLTQSERTPTRLSVNNFWSALLCVCRNVYYALVLVAANRSSWSFAKVEEIFAFCFLLQTRQNSLVSGFDKVWCKYTNVISWSIDFHKRLWRIFCGYLCMKILLIFFLMSITQTRKVSNFNVNYSYIHHKKILVSFLLSFLALNVLKEIKFEISVKTFFTFQKWNFSIFLLFSSRKWKTFTLSEISTEPDTPKKERKKERSCCLLHYVNLVSEFWCPLRDCTQNNNNKKATTHTFTWLCQCRGPQFHIIVWFVFNSSQIE